MMQMVGIDIELVKKNLQNISYYGRWDDVITLYNTELKEEINTLLKEQLDEDINLMNKGEPVSLLAKWLPSENKSTDRDIKFVENFCKMLNINKSIYRKKYIVPLRSYLNLIEIKMSENRWSEIDYNKVPSVAMYRLRDSFKKNDTERYKKWKEGLSEGKTTVNSSQVYPHELVKVYYDSRRGKDEVIEAQWREIVKQSKKLGKLDNSIVLCDVSGSMNGTPMLVSIALGILISSITKGKFNGSVITFSQSPAFHKVKGKSLQDKVFSLRGMDWGGNTNFQRVFDLILSRANECKLEATEMPKRLIVLSDMQFDCADSSNMLSNISAIEQKYEQSGYEMPELLFWNLRGDIKDVPVKLNTKKVGLVSGFSPSILKAVLDGDDFTPYGIMRQTIDDTRYDRIVE